MLILHYFRVAWRNLQQFKVYTTLAVISLAIGIMFFSGMWRFVQGMDNGIAGLPDVERCYIPEFQTANGVYYYRGLDYDEAAELTALQFPSVEQISGYSVMMRAEMAVEHDGEQVATHILTVRAVWGDFWTGFGCKMLYGDRLPQRPNEVVLSASAARKICGDAHPVGFLLRDVKPAAEASPEPYCVVNVIEDFDFGKLWHSDAYYILPDDGRVCRLNLMLTLAPGCDTALLADRVGKSSLGVRLAGKGEALRLRPVMEVHSSERFQLLRGSLLLLAMLVLLSGGICFLTFIIYRFYGRQRELALRKMMGARPLGLSGLLYAEVVWVLTLSLLLALPLTEWMTDSINAFNERMNGIKLFPSSYAIISVELVVYVVLLLCCCVIVQVPVWRLRRATVIHYVGRYRRRHLVRNVVLTIQFTISMFLVGGLVGFYRLTEFLESSYTRFLSEEDEMRVMRLEFTTETMKMRGRELMIALQERVRPVETTQVNYTALSSSTIGDDGVPVWTHFAPMSYFGFFHIPVQHLTADTTGATGVYVSRRLYDRLTKAGETTLMLGNTLYDVVGVYPELYGMNEATSRDVYGFELLTALVPMASVPGNRAPAQYFMRLHDGANPSESLEQIQQICREYVPATLPLELSRLDRAGDHSTVFHLLFYLFAVQTVICLLLLVMGIYTAVSMDTVGRQKEMALRKIYGASAWRIARHFIRLYVVQLAVAFVLAAPALLFLFGEMLGRPDFMPLLLTPSWPIVTLLIVASCVLLSIFTRIRRIVRINPVEFIRTE